MVAKDSDRKSDMCRCVLPPTTKQFSDTRYKSDNSKRFCQYLPRDSIKNPQVKGSVL